MVRSLILATVLTTVSAPAWAFAVAPLPAPGATGLVVAGVIGAIVVACRRK